MPEISREPIKLSDKARAVMEKLPSADVITVMEDVMDKVAGVNNSVNNSAEAGELSREELMTKVSSLPNARLKNILREHGVIR